MVVLMILIIIMMISVVTTINYTSRQHQGNNKNDTC